MLFLGKTRQAPARALLDAGAAIALATDFNPGTSPTVNFPLMLTLAVSQLRLSVAESVLAATVNGAAALGLAGQTGQIAPGYSADLTLFGHKTQLVVPRPTPPMDGALFTSHRDQLAAIGKTLAHRARGEAAILVGDLNATPWSAAFMRLLVQAKLYDSAVATGYQRSWPSSTLPLGIPIDHVLLSAQFEVKQRTIGPAIGSDHRPVVVDLLKAD